MNRNMSKLTAVVIAVILSVSIFASPAYAYDKEYSTYVSGHAHIDTAWQWDYETTISELIFDTWTKQLNLLNSNPQYKFSASSAQHYEWAKEYYPSVFESIRQEVANDRWDLAGGQWVEADTNIPSGESMVRQFLEGQTFFQKEFGKKSEVAFLPDDPGHSWIIPQIASKSGMKAFTATRISGLPGNDPFTTGGSKGFDNFIWKGVDGTEIMAYKPTQWYGSNMSQDDVTNSLDSPNDIGLKKSFFYYGDGDMGGGPTQAMIDAANEVNADPDQPNVIFSKLVDYFNSLTDEEKEKIPTFNDELYYNHELGLYTSRGEMKRYNNDNEISAETAEKLSSIALWSGAASYPADKLDMAWKKILTSQHHDVLPGCTVSSAAHDAFTNEEIAINLLGETKDYAMAAVSSRADTTGDGIPVMIFNSMSYARTDVVDTTVAFDAAPAAVRVYDAGGTEIPSQATIDGNQAHIVFLAKDVPSVGFAVYHAVAAETPGTYETGLSIADNTIQNNRYLVEINPANGNVNRIFDKANNRELLEAGKEIELQKLDDTSKDGWESWILDYDDLIATPTLINDNPQIELLENGPVRATYQVTKQDGSSTFKQKITLYSDIDRVDFPMTVDWHESNKMIKASFPLSVSNPKATFDLSYGTVERGNRTETKREVAAQKWADITDISGDFGVSILSECKYGWDKVDDSTIRLSLLRSPKDGVVRDYDMDMGVQNFTYSVSSHAGSWADGNTPQEANSMAKPLVAYQTAAHEGELGKAFSFVSVDKPNVMITAVKKAEDSNSEDLILRLYESQGRDNTDVNVTFAGKILSLNETNLIEENLGGVASNENTFSTNLHKYELKTFRTRIENAGYADTKPQTDSVDLSAFYNQDGMSYNNARSDGNMDGSGRTLPAELVPDAIVSEDIRFVTGPRQDGANNILKATGQVIPLNPGNYNTLYILGTAANGPQYGDFTVNYSDSTSTAKTLKFNDWCATVGGFGLPRIQDNIGYVVTHRHNSLADEADKNTYLYVYKIALDESREVSSIVLPDNERMKIVGMSLARGGFLPSEANETYSFVNDNSAIINDDSVEIAYSAGWEHDKNRAGNNFNGDIHYASVSQNPSLELTFSGTGIEYIAETDNNQGDVDVYIDDMENKAATVSIQSDSKVSGQVVYSNNALAPGQHKIRLVGVSGDWMVFDAFRVLNYSGSQVVVPEPPYDPEVTNDDSNKIRYTDGWSVDAGRPGAYNSDVHIANAAGEYCEFTFVGTDIECYGETGSDKGEIEIYIDGEKVSTVNAASFNPQYFQTIYSKKGLTPGKHKIRLVMASGNTMAVDGFKFANMPAPPADAQLVNNNSELISYYTDTGDRGGWGRYGGRGFGDYGDDVTATGSEGYYCEMEFTGTGVYLFSETNSDEGYLDIYIDDVFDKTISCITSSRIGAQQVYGKNGLPMGTHKIRVVNASEKWALIDAFKISANTTGSLLGTVLDRTGSPVSGATVSMDLSGSAVTVQTDETGDYIISNIGAGTGYSVTAGKEGFENATVSGITVESDGLCLVNDIILDRIPQAGTGMISGKITDGPGNGIDGVAISVDNTSSSAITNATGNFLLADIPEGAEYSITAAKDGYCSKTVSGIAVEEGKTTLLEDLLLIESGKGIISGRVLDQAGNGIGNAAVSIDGTAFTARTDASGYFNLFNVTAGSGYKVVASKSGYNENSISEVSLEEGVRITLDNMVLTQSSGPSNPPPSTPSTPSAPAAPTVGGNSDGSAAVKAPAAYNAITKTATTSLDAATLKKAFDMAKADGDGIKTVVVEADQSRKDARVYEYAIPSEYLANDSKNRNIRIETGLADVSIPDDMLTGAEAATAKDVVISVALADTSKLAAETIKAIGTKPVVELAVSINGKAVAWNNPEAPVTVSIPYTPTAEELQNKENITVWYMDGSGKITPVTNARYDSEAKAVVFKTTHFSTYAVAYVDIRYDDVAENAWMKKAVAVLSAKGIIDGTGDGKFSPDEKVTRGDYMMWLVRTLDLKADFDSNFADIKKTDKCYQEIGIAKELGITAGTGNNKYAPGKQITRQDMMVLTVKALRAANMALPSASISDLDKFTDKDKILKYALADAATMVKSGYISGSGNRINPASFTTRAETAAMLYNIYSRQ